MGISYPQILLTSRKNRAIYESVKESQNRLVVKRQKQGTVWSDPDVTSYSYRKTGLFSGLYWRLDIDMSLEFWVKLLAYCLPLFVFLGIIEADKSEILHRVIRYLNWGCFLSIALVCVRFLTDFTYVLDNGRRLLLYSRTFFGFTINRGICRFDEIKAVGLDVRLRSYKTPIFNETYNRYSYAVLLHLPDGAKIRVSEFHSVRRQVRALAAELAHHLNIRKRGDLDRGLSNFHSDRLPALLPVNSLGEFKTQPQFQGGSYLCRIFAPIQFWNIFLLIPILASYFILSNY